ncbi:YiiX/YebB-like N1pC/P60 family cysteine hydrolase [Alteromonas macleodii]|uniref:Permuted papain-like amidase enzyme, YaeF/YiiX, C92 family n=1 Tax=Alteromonas macleodii TaxID=28108 RepID=A0A6T9Y4M3_ALTMA|nr:YiiX/YebB-like N1pC/P60 family cysteine hydrolase [Alteromonas macleodii]CAB9495814.1 Permuted papain-like amidase enzyme, YaeF/YiiX, C92 family [Alteromonas macleodii]
MDETTYLLDIDKLKLGDIILSSTKSFSSYGIRFMTLGKYSHAAIYVGGTTIEATLEGVFSKNPQRLPFEKESQVAIFRHKSQLSEQQIQKLCIFARSKCGSLYALPEAITIRARSLLKIEETRKQFCSRLVAKAYEYAGVDLGNLRNPAYCTPKQLGLCNAFHQVTDVIKVASPEEAEFANTIDPNIQHQMQTFQWLGQVRDLVKTNKNIKDIEIDTLNDVNEFLLKYPEFDEQVSEYVKSSGYLEYYKYDSKVNPYRYNYILFDSVMKEQSDPHAFIISQYEKEPEMLRRFSQCLDGFIAYASQRRLKFYNLHIELYINLLNDIARRIFVISHGLECLGELKTADHLRKTNFFCQRIIELGRKELEDS